uniref:C2H2-type domain-containing protein n=1 Tax=Kalanchoe fedtschenkoi TaxID=63787 RepID=A0A7N0UDM0_KALFE
MDTTSPQKPKWDSKNPLKWSEVRRAVVPQDLPDWPLLSQGINFLKCKFCDWICFSTINLRRHECSHVQRRNNPEWFDEALKKISSLTKFWHERSRDLIKDVLSLQDVELKGITWTKIVEELTSMPEPNFRAPPSYYKARKGLLDTVKSEEPEFSISPGDFLEIIFHGSEKTFICNDTDESVQNHVFKDAEKIALEPENLVATTCFLLEQKLRKVWHAHLKDEAASLQNKLIMEEEDEKTRQPKTEGNKVEEKKRKKKNPKKQIVDDKGVEENLGQTSDTQQSAGTSRPEVPTSVEEDSQTPAGQLGHLPDASQICDAKKEDGEGKLEEEGSMEQKSEEGKKKKKKNKKKPQKHIVEERSEEGNLGQTSGTQQSTATSRPAVSASVEGDSQTPVALPEHLPDASQIRDAKKEDGDSNQKEEGSVEQKSEEGNLGQTSDTQQSTATSRPEVPTSVEEDSQNPVAQLEHLPDASQIRAAKKEDGEGNQGEEESKEQKSEEGNLGQTSDTQQSTRTFLVGTHIVKYTI